MRPDPYLIVIAVAALGVALARVPSAATGEVQVDIRGKLKAARIVKPTFVRRGKVLVA